MPRVFSIFGFGRGRALIGITMMPGVLLMFLGAMGIYVWLAYDLRFDNQGIYWRHGDRKVQQGAWNQLWDAKIMQYGKAGRKFINLEFFKGDQVVLMEDEDVGEDFSKLRGLRGPACAGPESQRTAEPPVGRGTSSRHGHEIKAPRGKESRDPKATAPEDKKQRS